MEDPLEKTKTTKSFTSTKSIISIPIESIFSNIAILVESTCDHVFILVELIPVESVKNSTPDTIIYDSTYLLALNVFILEISKETFNDMELKPGHLEPIKKETQSINLRIDTEPKMVQIGNTLTSSEKDTLVTLLKEFKEVFAWSYKDMPRIDIDIVQHCIPTNSTMKPVKQKLRRMKPKRTLKIKEEVEKQYNVGFLRMVNYP